MINVRKIVSRTRIAIESNKKSLWVICKEYAVHLPLWLNTLIHLRLWRTCSRCLHNMQWYSSCLRPRRESDCRQEAMHCGCTYLLVIRLASLHDTTRYLTCITLNLYTCMEQWDWRRPLSLSRFCKFGYSREMTHIVRLSWIRRRSNISPGNTRTHTPQLCLNLVFTFCMRKPASTLRS